jgi:hypothetical protein
VHRVGGIHTNAADLRRFHPTIFTTEEIAAKWKTQQGGEVGIEAKARALCSGLARMVVRCPRVGYWQVDPVWCGP